MNLRLTSLASKEVHCRRILECFCDDPEIHPTRNPLIALIPTDAENTRGKWFRMFTEYKCAFAIINKKPELMRGDDGYEEELREDAEIMQCHLDKWGESALDLCGDKIFTNYGFALKCGNFYRFMQRFGYLRYHRQDSMEHFQDDCIAWYHRHSQRGGSAGSGTGERQTTWAESMKSFFAQRLMFATGLDKEILAEHENHTKEVIRKASERLKAHYDRTRPQRKRRPGTGAISRKKKSKKSDQVERDFTRGGQLPNLEHIVL